MFDMLRPGLLAGGILCVALNLILRFKFSQNLPTNDSLKKVPVKLQVPENYILPVFFKILPPRRHSLGQRVRKGCGILSFSPSLYIYMYIPQNIFAAKKTSPHFLIQGILIQCLDCIFSPLVSASAGPQISTVTGCTMAGHWCDTTWLQTRY